MAHPQPKPPESTPEDAAADAQALADLKAGRTVDHETVKAWLRSWGTADELPPPDAAD